jgi:hypothetical protein
MKATWIAVCLSTASALASPAGAAVLDLNEFFFDPTVEVSADGTVAVLNEDPVFSRVRLSLDPGFGDPNLIIPHSGLELVFDYDIDIAASNGALNNDEFAAFLLDASTGFSLGGAFEFVTSSSAMGSHSFDLSSLVGQMIGLQFQLEALAGDVVLTSTAKISNVRVEETNSGPPDPTTVPEPGAAWLLLGGFALAEWKRRQR